MSITLRRGTKTPWIAGLAVLTTVATSFVVTIAPAAAAGPSITVGKQAPSSVLVGADAGITLTAANPSSNPSAATEFNLTFRDQLSIGVTYKAGSTTPASAGEPTIFTAPITGQQTLIWTNVSDLQIDSTFALRFSVTPNPALLPVGLYFDNVGDAYASTNPRTVPKFTAAGVAIADAAVQSANSSSTRTDITAIKVTKSEPSPEHELLRGIHDQTTVYTLTVTNNNLFATNGTVLTDYLPAGLEFLGCGGVDNSSAPEFVGAPSLTNTPTIPLVDCPTPASVATVSNPPADGATTYPAGVYTKVTWNLGNFLPLQTRVIKYAAGIPLRSNTMTFTGGTPTAASRLQTANLNNNNGASTRETLSEIGLTNTARIAGTFTGPLASGASASVASDDRLTVTAEDVSMQKSVSPGKFASGGIATFTILVRASEYVNASAVSVVDTLPDGLCPLSSTTNYSTGAVSACGALAGTDPTGATFASVVQQGDGTFEITFSDLTIGANGVATITFQARMLATYLSNGLPTVAGDSFTNVVNLTGTTTPIANTGETGNQSVKDDSTAGQTTTSLTLNKLIQPRQVPYTCDLGPYVEPTDPAYTATDFLYRKGGRICFELNVAFPSGSDSRNVVVTDVIPDGTAYEAGSATQIVNPSSPTYAVSFNEADAASGIDNPTWSLGDPLLGGGTYVPAGSTFKVRFSVIVQRSSDTTNVDIVGNLMKMRSVSSGGAAQSYRDQLDFGIAPAPPVTVVKGIAQIVSPSGTTVYDDPATAPNNIDGQSARAGDVVRFRVDVSNNGTAANGNDVAIRGVDVWDVLPLGITCADITNISAVSTDPSAPVGVCTNAGSATNPTFAQRATLGAIRWTFRTGAAGDPDAIPSGGSRTLTYDMTLPVPSRAGSTLTDTAYIRSFDAVTDLPNVVATYYPASNIDTTVVAADQDALPASDPSNVVIPSVTFSKSVIDTGVIDPPRNTKLTQAVNGETVTYLVRLDVPGRTSIFNGVITDPPPAGLSFVSATAGFSNTGVTPAVDPLPGSVTLNPANGTLTFPATYTNADTTTHRFEITVIMRVSPATPVGAKTNTAAFNNRATPGGTALAVNNKTASVTVIVPVPTFTKSNPTGGIVAGGQLVTYTLALSNGATAPTLQDSVVVDCLPAGLIFQSYGVPTQGSTSAAVPGDGTNGCAVTETKLTWNVGAVVGGTPTSLTYVVKVTTSAAGQVDYENRATYVGSTLADGANDPLVERVLTATQKNKVTAGGATITKTVIPTARTIGQPATYTVTATLPKDINFYNASVIDVLPAGFDRATLTTDTVTCTNADLTTCPLSATDLTQVIQGDQSTVIGWLLGDALASSQVRTVKIVYTATVRDLAGMKRNDTLVNSARVKWDTAATTPPTSAGATFGQQSLVPATATVTVQEPDLTITKSVISNKPAPGEPFTYTVTVRNSSAVNVSSAYNVAVSDAIPVGVVVQLPLPADASIAGAGANGGGTITWLPTGSIASGASRVLTYNAVLADSSTLNSSTLTNTADITSYRSQPSAGRTYDGPTAQAAVTPAFPAFTVTKTTPDGSLAYINEQFPWEISVKNTGGADAFDVDVSDVLPPNWRYLAGSAVISVASGPISPINPTSSAITGDVQTLKFTDVGDLAVGETLVVRFTAAPTSAVLSNPMVGSLVPHTNAASATGDDATHSPGNLDGPYTGSDTADAHIDSADVVMTKTHGGPVVAGSTFTWKLDVSNNGNDVAVGQFTVSDEVPVGPTLVSAAGAGWSCSVVARQVTCQRTNGNDTLASGASFATIVLTMTVADNVAEGTKYLNEASVANRTYDPNTGNNTDPDEVTVTTDADLGVTKLLSGAMVAGEVATYTIDVVNNGPSISRADIVVVDNVPAGTTFESATGVGWNCPESGGVITCTRNADLAVGVPAGQITVKVKVDAGRTAPVVNKATVSGVTTDTKPSNDESTVTKTPGASADLSLTKVSTGSVTAGERATYRFEVTNGGPSDAAAVSIEDTLPTGLTYFDFSSVDGTWSCSVAAGKVTCDLAGTLATGATASVDVRVDVASSVLGSVTNTAHVSSTTPDPDDTNNTATDDSAFTADGDLQIVKSHTGTVVAGRNLAFKLAVTNNGPSDVEGDIVVKDVLPAEFSFVSASGGPSWSCGESAGTVTCTRTTTLAAGADAADITLTVAIDPSAGPATITNTATVQSTTTPDTKPGNNSFDDDVVVTDSTELTLQKTTTGDNPVIAGQRTEFSLVVTNEGDSTADAVTLIDTLPAGFSDIVITENGWDCDAPVGLQITCRLTELLPGDSPTLKIAATVNSDVLDGATLTNGAVVSTTTPGDTPAGNTASSDVDVIARADLALTKTAPTDPIEAGKDVTYTLAVKNIGPSDAVADVVITDRLPAGFIYSSNSGPWTCVADPATPTGQDLTCTLDASAGIPAGGNAPDLRVLVAISPDNDSGVYTNDARVTSGTIDDQSGNDRDTADVTVARAVDLTVTKSHTGTTLIGDDVTFTMRVTNNGPSRARDVVAIDTLPTGLQFVSADGAADGFTCDEIGSVVTCDLAGTLAVDEYAEFTVTARVLASAFPSATNSVTVESDLTDLKPSDNTATDKVTVPALVDLSITKSHADDFTVGSTGTYKITVSNGGPTDDPGTLTVTDTLPTGLTYSSATGTGWNCDAVGQVVTCTNDGGLANGASSAITLVVDVLPSAAPGVTNSVTVSTPSTETDPDNNTTTDPTPVTPLSKLTIDKQATSFAGTTAAYRITVGNEGPNATSAPIVVTDKLPKQLTYVSSSGTGWACSAISQTVTCTFTRTLAVGASTSVAIVTSVKATPGDSIVNVATVTGGGGGGTGTIATDNATITAPPALAPTIPKTGANVMAAFAIAMVLVVSGVGLRNVARERRRA